MIELITIGNKKQGKKENGGIMIAVEKRLYLTKKMRIIKRKWVDFNYNFSLDFNKKNNSMNYLIIFKNYV